MRNTVTFCDFVERLGIELTDAQWTLATVAFDGVDPELLFEPWRSIARQLFGDVRRFPPEARDVVAVVAGARAGKTYILLALRCLHLAMTCDLSSLAPGEIGFGIIVAERTDLAHQALRFVVGAARKSPTISRRIIKDAVTELQIRRPDGRIASIKVLPASRGGAAVRARSYYFVGLDEACFFHADDGYTVTDKQIFDAATDRVLPGGQLVMCSTPWLPSGVLHDLFVRNHPDPSVAIDGETRKGTPTDAIAVHAQTLVLRDTPKLRRVVERAAKHDPERHAREFLARFVQRGTNRWFDPIAIKQAAVERPATLEPKRGTRTIAALDPGFTSDSCALVVLHIDGGKIRVAEIVERRPPKGAPLKPTVVLGELLAIAQRHGCTAVWTDVAFRASVHEAANLRSMQVLSVHGGNQGKVEIHTIARQALHNGKCEWSTEHTVLSDQLREVLHRKTDGGGISFTSPRRGGRHGDIASAWILATWVAATWQTRIERAERDRASGATGVLMFDLDVVDPETRKRIEDGERIAREKGDDRISDEEQGAKFWSGAGETYSTEEIHERGTGGSDYDADDGSDEEMTLPRARQDHEPAPGIKVAAKGSRWIRSSDAHRYRRPLPAHHSDLSGDYVRRGTVDHPTGCACGVCPL